MIYYSGDHWVKSSDIFSKFLLQIMMIKLIELKLLSTQKNQFHYTQILNKSKEL